MKKCIWCSKDETKTSFERKAHTFPQSLGGKNVCENVCDFCNSYFGNKESTKPSVEIALKEILNLSKHILLRNLNEKGQKRHTSEYFNFNSNTNTLKYKIKYQFRKGFQEEFARRFKRGIYKVFLEERERQRNDAFNLRFDFIREFARYDFSDYPVYYIKPKFKAVFLSLEDIKNPQIRFTDYSDKIDSEFKFYTYTFFGHNFAIPTSKYFHQDLLIKFKNYLIETNDPFGTELIEIINVEDIDFRFNHIRD